MILEGFIEIEKKGFVITTYIADADESTWDGYETLYYAVVI